MSNNFLRGALEHEVRKRARSARLVLKSSRILRYQRLVSMYRCHEGGREAVPNANIKKPRF